MTRELYPLYTANELAIHAKHSTNTLVMPRRRLSRTRVAGWRRFIAETFGTTFRPPLRLFNRRWVVQQADD